MRASNIAMSAIMLAIFAAMTGIAMLNYPAGARFQPLVIGIPAIALCVLQLMLDLRAGSNTGGSPPVTARAGHGTEDAPLPIARELRAWGWFLGLVAGVLLAGFWITIPLFVTAFLHLEARTGLRAAISLGLGATAALYALFVLLLRASLHEGFLLTWLWG